jgi:hypothetical protein
MSARDHQTDGMREKHDKVFTRKIDCEQNIRANRGSLQFFVHALLFILGRWFAVPESTEICPYKHAA